MQLSWTHIKIPPGIRAYCHQINQGIILWYDGVTTHDSIFLARFLCRTVVPFHAMSTGVFPLASCDSRMLALGAFWSRVHTKTLERSVCVCVCTRKYMHMSVWIFNSYPLPCLAAIWRGVIPLLLLAVASVLCKHTYTHIGIRQN